MDGLKIGISKKIDVTCEETMIDISCNVSILFDVT